MSNSNEKFEAYMLAVKLKEDYETGCGITIGEISDGYHTFDDLYYQRLVLFATICNQNPDRAWKSKLHADGTEPFGGGWFIVGVDTPEGPYTYHYELNDWELFHCPEIQKAPEWDGHTSKDVRRVLSIVIPIPTKPHCIYCSDRFTTPIGDSKDATETRVYLDGEGTVSVFTNKRGDTRQGLVDFKIEYCPKCGRSFRKEVIIWDVKKDELTKDPNE